ncbi:MAG: hypothetical protein WKF34_14555, partial [Pyrinomonadaceae bacterium]
MKRCPQCRRDYYDDTLLYCLDDGNALLEGPASGSDELDEPATAILSEPPVLAGELASSESSTRTFDRTTDQASILSVRPSAGNGSRPISSAEYLVGEVKKRKVVVAALLALVIVAGSSYFTYRHFVQTKPAHFERVKLTRITTEGNLQNVAVSPDGKYIAYTLLDAGKRSLWTKHLATGSRVPIVAPTDANIMTPYFFSHDGGYVFYGLNDEQNPTGAFFQVAVLGGPPKKILTDFASPVGLSPDGKRLAFARYRPGVASEQYQVWLADADGANESRLWS